MGLEEELQNQLGKNELEIKIAEKIKSYYGFLTREAAVKIIAREKDLLKDEIKKIAEISKGSKRISLEVKVRKVWPVAKYQSGKISKTVEIEDNSGTASLILWNNDSKIALRSNDKIKLIGCYEKGGEIHLGYNGKIELIEKAEFADFANFVDGSQVHVKGKITNIEGYDAFVQGINTSKAFSFMISDGKNERRVIIWEDQERGEKLKKDDELIIEDCLINKGNIELSNEAKILARRDMLIGNLKKIECVYEDLNIEIDGKELTLDRLNALKFFGLTISQDILLSTVVSIKKDEYINSKIAVKMNNGEVLNACIKLESF